MKGLKYLLVFACFVPLLIFRDFTPNNELKYLSIADEALRDGHWFAFWNHGAAYADKPPLYLWIVMLGKWLFGTHSMFFLGLFSVIPALVTLRVMDKWTMPYLNERYRNSAFLALMTSGLFVGSAVVLRMDMLMCMFIVLALYTFFKMYSGQAKRRDGVLLPVYIFLALFTKGPVGLLVPVLCIPVFLATQHRLREYGRYFGWRTWGILLALCAVWFGCVFAEGGKEYLNNLLFNQTVNRAVDAFHHKEPVWYYLKTIWYSLAPWILLYVVAIVLGIRRHLLNTDLKRFFMVIIATTFIALSVFSGKLDIYMLPIFPFIAYLAFLMMPGLKRKALLVMVGIPAGVLVLAFPAYFVAMHYVTLPVEPTWLYPFTTLLLSAGAGCSLYWLFRKQLRRAIDSLAIGLLLTVFAGSFALPQLDPYMGFRAMSEKAQSVAHEEGIDTFYYHPFRSAENIDAYIGCPLQPLEAEEIAARAEKERFVLFLREKNRRKNPELQAAVAGHTEYRFGDYAIVIFD